MKLEDYLYSEILDAIKNWNEENIYAISFLVGANESSKYNGIKKFPNFYIGYNTEEGCDYAEEDSEERWNTAFWTDDMIAIIDADDNPTGSQILLNYYKEKGIENIGFEDEDSMYDDEMKYIGKGPVGFYELLSAVSDVANRLQSEGKIEEKFGKIPIIVHDLDYAWYSVEATKKANPNGQADVFLSAYDEIFGL